MTTNALEPNPGTALLADIRQLIEETRTAVAVTVNSNLTLLYWQIGWRIHKEILNDARADYGRQIVAVLAKQLTQEYGRGFTEQNLRHMMRFAEVFPDQQILYAPRRELSWSHFRRLMYLDDPLKRDFYTELCRMEQWSTRTLQAKIDGMLYERTALSRKPEEVVRHELDALRTEDRVTPDLLFKDPYLLDFLGIRDHYYEKDLEDAILREMEAFLLELGAGFAFLSRQKRIQVDDDDFYIDLLFYNRRLRRLVAIDLKLGDFKPADKGQMELYLRWLDRYERQPHENPPLGIILCSGKKTEQIELLELDKSGIRVAEYLIELPPREVLAKKLHTVIAQSRARLAQRTVDQTQVEQKQDDG